MENYNKIKCIIRILWFAAPHVRYHHSNIHGRCAGQVLDHCRETMPIDCDEEQVHVHKNILKPFNDRYIFYLPYQIDIHMQL